MGWVAPGAGDWATGMVLTSWHLQTRLHDRLVSLRSMNDHAVHLSLADRFDVNVNERQPIRWSVQDWIVGSEIWDDGSPSHLLAPVAGWYGLDATIEWNNASGGTRALLYRINDVPPDFDLRTDVDVNGLFGTIQSGAALMQMTTADFTEVCVYQNSTDSLTINGGAADRVRCCWRLVGAAS